MANLRTWPAGPDLAAIPGRPAAAVHDHLWLLPDGTGLHAPIGNVTVDELTGRVCCHLCGKWFTSLGSHVRVHGYSADSYRAAMGLMRTRSLASAELSASISDRQARRYRDSAEHRGFMAEGHALARSGQLAWRARSANGGREDRPERAVARRDELARERATAAAQREQRMAGRLAALGAASLTEYLLAAHAAGATLAEIRQASGLGQEQLRRALAAAGIAPRPTGRNTAAGKRSRALAADSAAAELVGTSDLRRPLRARSASSPAASRTSSRISSRCPWTAPRHGPAVRRCPAPPRNPLPRRRPSARTGCC